MGLRLLPQLNAPLQLLCEGLLGRELVMVRNSRHFLDEPIKTVLPTVPFRSAMKP